MTDNDQLKVHLAAAERGDGASMLYIAEAYSEGDGVANDARLAILWYERAAKAGVVDAMLELARLYATGSGVPQDLLQCRWWLNKAYGADHLITIRRGRTR